MQLSNGITDNKFREQLISKIKENLPNSGKAPEIDTYNLVINREYKKVLTACGKRVALEKKEKLHERFVDDIYIPTKFSLGFNLTEAIVKSVGRDAVKYNLKEGDTVVYDHFSAFYDTHPMVVTNIENIILVDTDDGYIPIGKYIEVELTDILLDTIPEGIYLLEDSKPKYIYKVISIGTGYEDYKFNVKVNDLIMIGGNPADDITITIENKKRTFIFTDNIVAFYKG